MPKENLSLKYLREELNLDIKQLKSIATILAGNSSKDEITLQNFVDSLFEPEK